MGKSGEYVALCFSAVVLDPRKTVENGGARGQNQGVTVENEFDAAPALCKRGQGAEKRRNGRGHRSSQNDLNGGLFMIASRLIPCLSLLLVFHGNSNATDLTKIDRAIGKEP